MLGKGLPDRAIVLITCFHFRSPDAPQRARIPASVTDGCGLLPNRHHHPGVEPQRYARVLLLDEGTALI